MQPFAPIEADDTLLWMNDRNFRQLEARLDVIRLLSFDVFDTLLFRGCAQPSDLFLQVGRAAIEEGLLAEHVAPDDFLAMRRGAERQARSQDPSGEVTLEDIYRHMPAFVKDPWRAMELELEAEKAVCYLNPHAVSLLRHAKSLGIRVALVSDMYLSGEQIVSLLTANGFDASLLDIVIVSSEAKCGKSSGKLFDSLLAAFPAIRKEEIVHIGDNETADVRGAAKRGIASLPYNVVPEHIRDGWHWESIRHGDVLPGIKSLRKLAAATIPLKYDDEEERFFYRFGAGMLGPFFQGFCDWILDTCVAAGRMHIHPLMREAVLLAPMLEHAAAMRGLPVKVTPLYVSRQATLLAAMDDFRERELCNVFQLNSITVGETLGLLGLDAREFPAWSGRLDLAVAEQGNKALRGELSRLLLAEPVRGRIRRTIEERRRELIEYLRQTCGESDMGRLVTVDIGFNGTIQAALQAALDNEGIANDAIHLMAAGTDRSAGLRQRGLDIRAFIGSSGEYADLAKQFARSPGFIEELTMSEFGSTTGYARDANGRIGPVFAQLALGEEQFRYKRACREGAFTFQRYYAYLRQAKPNLCAHAAPREWAKLLHRVIDMPTPEEAARLGDLTHQDNFGGVHIEPLCSPIPERWLSLGADHFIDLSNFGPKTANVYWPQGTATRHFPFHLYRGFARQADAFGSRILAFNVISQAADRGITSIRLFGEGPAADMLLREAILHGVHITEFIAPHDTARLDAAIRDDEGTCRHSFVIATLSEMPEYAAVIRGRYALLKPDVSPLLFEPFA